MPHMIDGEYRVQKLALPAVLYAYLAPQCQLTAVEWPMSIDKPGREYIPRVDTNACEPKTSLFVLSHTPQLRSANVN